MKIESIGEDTWYNFHQPVWKLAEIFRISVLFAFFNDLPQFGRLIFPIYDQNRCTFSILFVRFQTYGGNRHIFSMNLIKKNAPNLVINRENYQFKLKKNIAKTQIILKPKEFIVIFIKILIKTGNENIGSTAFCSIFMNENRKNTDFRGKFRSLGV